jgi:hypothetical protein
MCLILMAAVKGPPLFAVVERNKQFQPTYQQRENPRGGRLRKVLSTVETIFVYHVGESLVAGHRNQTIRGGVSYLTQDHLGSTRVETDAEKSPRARYDYLPYGEGIQVGRVGSHPLNDKE